MKCFLHSVLQLLVTANVPPKRRFLQEQNGATFQKTTFFTVTALTGLCSGDVMFPVMYELGFYIPGDGILHNHRRQKPQIVHSINRMGSVAEM
jgi:membrane-bound metal-dependent hydrolase YbcI (DUF457 family)